MISNVESTMYGDKERKMVKFKLGEEKKKNIILSMSRTWDKEKKLNPRRESNP